MMQMKSTNHIEYVICTMEKRKGIDIWLVQSLSVFFHYFFAREKSEKKPIVKKNRL